MLTARVLPGRIRRGVSDGVRSSWWRLVREYQGEDTAKTCYLMSMQRDMDLIRQILFRMEDHSGGFAPRDCEIEGDYTADQIGYHVWLLGNAGLIKATDVTSLGSDAPQAIPMNLTWEGHDFIAAARNDTIWSHAKEKAKSVGGSLSLAVFKQLLDSLVKHQLGLLN